MLNSYANYVATDRTFKLIVSNIQTHITNRFHDNKKVTVIGYYGVTDTTTTPRPLPMILIINW